MLRERNGEASLQANGVVSYRTYRLWMYCQSRGVSRPNAAFAPDLSAQITRRRLAFFLPEANC